MPQMNKGEKYIFGKSLIQDDLTIYLSSQAVEEYHAGVEGRAYLFTASESAGGFCVTRRGLLEPSKLGHILAENPALRDYQIPEGEFIQFKGRSYCWVAITSDGAIQLKPSTLEFLDLEIGMELQAIKSSNIAFTMGAKGPLLEKAKNYAGEIKVY